MAKPVFISYTHGAGGAAAEALRRALGPETAFLDSDDIESGENFVDGLLNAMLGARVVVAFLDPTYFQRAYCRFEYEVATSAYQMLVERRGTEAEKAAALAHVVIALPPQPSPGTVDRLPRVLQETDWVRADETAALAALVRSRMKENPTLGEQLDRLDEPEALRSRLKAMALPEPQNLAAVPTYARPGALPHSLEDAFLGRGDDLWEIHHVLTTKGETAAARTVILEGGGGVGKTRLAAEYLYRFGPQHFPGGLFWVSADASADGRGEQLHGILSTLVPGVPDWATFRDEQKRDVAEELRKALRSLPPQAPVLFVVDDVPEPAPGAAILPLEAWCPAPGQVSLVVTTRLRRAFSGTSIPVDVPSPTDARALLTCRYSDPDVLTAAEWDQVTGWVGRLPLALVLLNAVLVEGSYEAHELLETAQGSTPYRHLEDVAEAVRATRLVPGIGEAFLLSYEHLPDSARRAARLVAQLGPATIPLRLLQVLGPDVSSHATRHLLLGRSMVSRVRDERRIPWFGQMHPLLGDFLRAQADDPDAEFALACAALLAAIDPQSCRDPRAWPVLNACRPHAEHLYARAKATAATAGTGPSAVALGLRVASLLRAQGRLTAAASLAGDVVALARGLWGAADRRSLEAASALAETLRAQGKLDAAQRLDQAVLEMSERELPPDDADTLAYQAQLAGTLAAQGERDQARERLHRVVETSDRVLGPGHMDTLSYKQELAAILAADGYLEEACRLQASVAEAAERTLGAGHPLILRAKANLAEMLAALGRLDQARRLQEAVVRADPPVLPPDHPDSLLYRAALAAIVAAQGDLDEARRLQEDVVQVWEQSPDREDPDTLRVAARVTADLGLTVWQQGERELARRHLAAALDIGRETGRRSGDEAQFAWNLFVVLRTSGEEVEAEQVRREHLAWLLDRGPEELDAGQEDVRQLLLDVAAPAPVAVAS